MRAARRILRRSHPGVEIAGRRNGYFRRDEEARICDEINRSGADVLWVGLGVPLEYEFCLRNKDRLKVGWIVTCGGCFNFAAGDYVRAPQWMQKAGLEWLHRLWREPKRLFWRYLVTNPVAIAMLLLEHRQREIEVSMSAGAQQALPFFRGSVRLRAQGVLAHRHPLRLVRHGTGRRFRRAFHRFADFPAHVAGGRVRTILVPIDRRAFLSGPDGRFTGRAGVSDARQGRSHGAHGNFHSAEVELAGRRRCRLVVAALMFSTHAGTTNAILFGLYGVGSTLRYFARSLSNVHARLLRVAGSDLIYAVLLVAGLEASSCSAA